MFDEIFGTKKPVRSFGDNVPRPSYNIQYGIWPSCCGAGVISNFYPFLTGDYRSSVPGAQKFKQEMEAAVATAKNNRHGMVTAIINNIQRDGGIGKLLEEAGFVLVFATTNPNHQDITQIFMYCLDLTRSTLNKDLKLGVYDKKSEYANLRDSNAVPNLNTTNIISSTIRGPVS